MFVFINVIIRSVSAELSTGQWTGLTESNVKTLHGSMETGSEPVPLQNRDQSYTFENEPHGCTFDIKYQME